MEIEVKARLEHKDEVMKKLAALGCMFSLPKTQDDVVWSRNAGSLEQFLSNDVFMRIRVQDSSEVILTAKKSKSKTGDASLIKKEHEVIVDSKEEAREILRLMGLCEVVRVMKTRQTTVSNGYEICIDDVEGLGSFIELEKIAEEGDADRIQKEMFEFLATLGIKEEDQVMKGYDILALEALQYRAREM